MDIPARVTVVTQRTPARARTSRPAPLRIQWMQMVVRVVALTLVAVFGVVAIIRAANRTAPSTVGGLDEWLLAPSLLALVAVVVARHTTERPTDFYPQALMLAFGLGFFGITDLSHPLLWLNVLPFLIAGVIALRDSRRPRVARPDIVPFRIPG